jgi:hypothetical protein
VENISKKVQSALVAAAGSYAERLAEYIRTAYGAMAHTIGT